MRRALVGVLALLGAFSVVGCNSNPEPRTEAKRDALQAQADVALKDMDAKDPGFRDFVMNRSYGYAVFPSIGAGGLIAGGAHGRGVVYEQGQMIGYANLNQASIGLKIGGYTFEEGIVFENAAAVNRLRAENLAFEANASAVVLKAGASAASKFDHGMEVFVVPTGGLILDGSIGGQKITFESGHATTQP